MRRKTIVLGILASLLGVAAAVLAGYSWLQHTHIRALKLEADTFAKSAISLRRQLKSAENGLNHYKIYPNLDKSAAFMLVFNSQTGKCGYEVLDIPRGWKIDISNNMASNIEFECSFGQSGVTNNQFSA